MQMLFITMLIDVPHATLENAVVAFNRVHVDLRAGATISVAPFFAAIVDAVMLPEMVAEFPIGRAFVSHDVRLFRNVGLDNRDDVFAPCAIDMKRAYLAGSAINKRGYCILMAEASLGLRRPFLAANERLVNLNDLAFLPWAPSRRRA
jgi:hypothetical protein